VDAGVGGFVCPECGKDATGERGLRRTRRRWRWAAAALVLLLCARGAMLGPKMERDGWPSVFPIPVLHAILWPFDSWGEDLYEREHASGWGQLRSGGLTRWERLLLARQVALHIDDPESINLRPRSAGHRLTRVVDACFAHLDREGRLAVPAYLRMLASDESVRVERARRALRRRDAIADLIVRRVVDRLPGLTAELQLVAHLAVLTSYGSRAREAVPIVVEVMQRDGLRPSTRSYCFRVIGYITDEEEERRVVQSLMRTAGPEVRAAAPPWAHQSMRDVENPG